MHKTLLISPPPRFGGGPSNAILRLINVFESQRIGITTNPFSFWNVVLLNVGTGIRFDVLRLLRFRRRMVYRVDGCFSEEIFEKQGRVWRQEYALRNKKITIGLKTADHVIYQSHFSKNFLDNLFKRDEGTYSVIKNATDLNLFFPRKRSQTSLPVLGCISTFRANRVKILLDIAVHIPFRHNLVLVGRMDRQCKADLDQFNASNHNSLNLKYIPEVVDQIKLAEYYQKIDCFLHPFIGDTCSNAVVESLACGTPAIVPLWSGSSELVGKGGVLVKNSPWEHYNEFIQEYADATTKVITDNKAFSEQARARACETMDIIETAKAYIEALSMS